MLVSVIFGACVLSSVANAAKILGIFLSPSYSHQIVYQPIWKELSLRGHQVTVYTPNPLNDKSLVNLTEYDLGFSYEAVKTIGQTGQDFTKTVRMFENAADLQLSHPFLQDLIANVKNDTFDLLLVEYIWQPMYAFKDIYKVPMVGITSLPLTIQASDVLGMEKHPVLEPDLFMQFSVAKSLKQRVLSWSFKWIYRFMFHIKLNHKINAQIKKYFGQNAKGGIELASEASLVLGNYNFVLRNIRPTVPSFVPISAIHVQPPKALPLDLSKFLENLKNDVIYFSLGTNVNSSLISQEALNRILTVLNRLPYTILWKYDSDTPPKNLPKNVLIRKWFPQQDLLAHQKVKLFITQGGIQSIDEALSRKVPMLIIPMHWDQQANADRCAHLGIAEVVNFLNFSEEELEQKITKVLTDPSYQRNIAKQSLIASDQPLNSLDTAIFWIEYVIRHQGAPHLRYGAADLPFYQYYLLDVYAFVGVILALFYYIVKRLAAIVVLTYRVSKRLIVAKYFGVSHEKNKKEKAL